MKYLAIIFICISAMAADPVKAKKLVSVHFNVVDRELCWDVMMGRMENNEFVSEKLDEQPCISADRAEMTYAGETRGFDRKEADQLDKLLETLARYAVESSVWFDSGKGERKEPLENAIKAKKE